LSSTRPDPWTKSVHVETEQTDEVHGLVGDLSKPDQTLSETGSQTQVWSGRSSGIWLLEQSVSYSRTFRCPYLMFDFCIIDMKYLKLHTNVWNTCKITFYSFLKKNPQRYHFSGTHCSFIHNIMSHNQHLLHIQHIQTISETQSTKLADSNLNKVLSSAFFFLSINPHTITITEMAETPNYQTLNLMISSQETD